MKLFLKVVGSRPVNSNSKIKPGPGPELHSNYEIVEDIDKLLLTLV